MALIQCPECESKVSNRAHACPRCGYPIEELTSYQDAILHNKEALVPDLVRAGFPLNELSNGKTPLMHAARLGSTAVVRQLIEAGADVNCARADGCTALMDAVSNGHKEIVEMLLQAGADPDLKNQDELSAIDLAIQKNKINILPFFHIADRETSPPKQEIPPPLPEIAYAPVKSDSQMPPLPEEYRKEDRYEGLTCKSCKAQITPDEIWCSQCKAPIIRRYCGGCKRLIPEIAASCPFCNSQKIGRFRYIRNLEQIVAAVIVFAIIGFTVSIYSPRTAQNKNIEVAAKPTTQRTLPDQQTPADVHKETADEPDRTKGASNDSPSAPEREQNVPVHVANRPQPKPKVPGDGFYYENARRLNNKGFELMQQGRYEEAIPVLASSLRSFPSNSRKNLTYAYALYNLGRSLRLAGRPDLAIPILEERMKYKNQLDVVANELDLARQDHLNSDGRYTNY